MWLSVSRSCRCGLGWLLLLDLLGRSAGRCALGLVELRSGNEVLHDGAVDGELESRGRVFFGGRLGDDGLEYVGLW